MKLFKPQESIMHQIIFLVMALATLAIAAWASVTYNSTRIELTHAVNIQLRETAYLTLNEISHYGSPIQLQELGLSHVLGSLTLSKNQQALLLHQTLASHPELTELSLIDDTGTERLRVSRIKGYTDDDLRNMQQDSMVQRGLNGISSISSVYYSDFSEPEIVSITPVMTGNNKQKFLLRSLINLRGLWDIVHELSNEQNISMYVVDSRLRLMAHPDRSYVLSGIVLNNVPYADKLFSHKEPATAVRYKNIQGIDVMGIAILDTKNQWWVIIEQPYETAFASLSNIIKQSLLAMLLILVFLVVAVVYLSPKLLKPLNALIDATKKIQNGERNVRITSSAPSEIQNLNNAFNEMAQNLDTTISTLKYSEERYRKLLSTAPCLICILEPDGTVLYVNNVCTSITGYKPEDIIGKNWWDLLYPGKLREQVNALYKKFNKQDFTGQEMQLRNAAGNTRTISWNSFNEWDHQGNVNKIRIVGMDITDRVKAEQQARIAATTFETHEAIMITDAKTRIIRVNNAFTETTGYTAEEAIGNTPNMLQSNRHDKDFYNSMWRSINTYGIWQGEIWNRRKNGEVFPEWLTITAITDNKNNISNYVASFVDLTEQRLQQETIERAAAEEHVLAELLRISLQPLEMEAYLYQALHSLLVSVPWLKLMPRGAIFLTEEQDNQFILEMKASYNLNVNQMQLCAEVPFGKCLCGRSALQQAIIFAPSNDERHDIQLEDMDEHGHYNVPIVSGDTVLGVIVLYVPIHHKRQLHEEAFLLRVADVLSMGINHRHSKESIQYLAYHDELTDLANRRLLIDHLQQELTIARQQSLYGTLLFLDMDHFKTLNDSLGHSIGDSLLRQVAQRLREQIKEGDTVARLGGDEFMIMLSALDIDEETAAHHALEFSETVRMKLAEPYLVEGHEFHLTASIGIVLFPSENDNSDDIIKHADAAMYQAKADGRNTVRFFLPSMQESAYQRLTLERDIRRALLEQSFSLNFQPQVDADKNLIGTEVLLRWQHPQRGFISPAEFIPVAEESGLILQLGEWVLRSACEAYCDWLSNPVYNNSCKHIAVNVSPKQFHQAGFVNMVAQILDETGMPAEALILEITESIVIQDIEDTILKMQSLRTQGVRFSIDDFGTGYSSMAYLKRLPADELKIDQSFVRDVANDPNDAAIVDTIITLATNLELNVIAEGVETREEYEFLASRGCQSFQGYFFSHPLSREDFQDWLINCASACKQ